MKKSLLVLILLILISIPAVADETEANACLIQCKLDCTNAAAGWFLDCMILNSAYDPSSAASLCSNLDQLRAAIVQRGLPEPNLRKPCRLR